MDNKTLNYSQIPKIKIYLNDKLPLKIYSRKTGFFFTHGLYITVNSFFLNNIFRYTLAYTVSKYTLFVF
jgi:hypothetical protein